jgi:hypothetical protein
MTADQRKLLHLYEQLAQTMQILIEIQQLEDQEDNQTQDQELQFEQKSSKIDKQLAVKRRLATGLFDDDEDDIRRFEQVKISIHL